ncbi:MAG TPA: sulfatase-like hydrolase/transferase [Chitinophagaceae bacterium]|nr:sulfatase-like hydrolase/transferase [Chitinophagaceae bacterium]
MRSKISPLTKWTFAAGFTFLIFMTLLRLIFFEHFKTAGYSFANSSDAFLLGLRYDLRICCAIVFPLLLVGSLHLTYNSRKKLTALSIVRLIAIALFCVFIVFFLKNNKGSTAIILSVIALFLVIFIWLFLKKNCNPFADSTAAKIWKTYFLIVTILLVFFYSVDFQHYDYLHQRLNASVLNYTEDAKISFTMVWQTYPVLTLSIAILISVFIIYWLINKWYKIINASNSHQQKFQPVFSIILFMLLALAIFGRVGQYPLRWSDAFTFGNEFKSSVALNPVQSFFSTLKFRHSGYDEKKVRYYYPMMVHYLGIQKPDSSKLNFERTYTFSDTTVNKPNVVLVICESFSAYKSSMWGNPLNTTPYFNELSKQGVFFDHCFSPAYGTARGVWAIITGIPDVETSNTASRNPAAVDQHTIINDLKGYQKFYFLGGSTSWANIRGLLTNNINDLKLYEEEDYRAKAIDVWGISDKHLFLEANDILKQQTAPFFAVIQTADNHRPYTIPSEDLDEFNKKEFPTDTLKKYGFDNNDELNAFRYTDFCYQKFMEAAKKEKYFQNTIFVFIGDHGIRGNAGDMFPKAWTEYGITTQHVPLLFYAPALLKPSRLNGTCSQIDILPTVASLIKMPYRNTTLGRNLFDTVMDKSLPFYEKAFLIDPEERKIGMMTNDYYYSSSLLTGKENFSSSKNNDPLPPTSGSDKKILRDLTNACYETAKYMILNNKKGNLRK